MQPVKVEKVNVPAEQSNTTTNFKESNDEIAQVNKLLKKSLLVRNSAKSKKNQKLLESKKRTKETKYKKSTTDQVNIQKSVKSKKIEDVDEYLSPCDFIDKAQIPTELFKYEKFLNTMRGKETFKLENLYCPPCNSERNFIEQLHGDKNTPRKILHSNAVKTANYISKSSSELSRILLSELERFGLDKTISGQYRMQLVLENVIQTLEKLQVAFKELITSDIIIDEMENVNGCQSSVLNLNVVCPSNCEAHKVVEIINSVKSLEFLNNLNNDTSKNIIKAIENILNTSTEINNELVNAFKTVFSLLTNSFTVNPAILIDF